MYKLVRHASDPGPGRGRSLLAGVLLATAILLVLSLFRTQETPGPPSPPEEMNGGGAVVDSADRLSPSALDAAESEVRRALTNRAFPGAALAVGIGPTVDRTVGMGSIGWGAAASPVSPDSTLYDLASLTKAVATTTAVLLLADDGLIHLDEPVRNRLPEFEGRYKDDVTWRHLLTHTAGLPGGAVIRGDDPEERLRRLLRTRLGLPPGRSVEYTDLGFLVLWAAAEAAAGEPLENFLERRVWRPLGMHRTGFSPGMDCSACAPTLRLRDGTPFRGRPHDLYARRLGGVAGNAGLFSTAGDLARFAAMIANGGELDGVRILREESVRELFLQQPGAGRRSLGWQAFCPAEPPDEALPCEDPIAYGHTGYTGTSLWIDPPSGMWMVLLANRTFDIRDPQAAEQVHRLRADVWEVLRSAPGGSSPGGAFRATDDPTGRRGSDRSLRPQSDLERLSRQLVGLTP